MNTRTKSPVFTMLSLALLLLLMSGCAAGVPDSSKAISRGAINRGAIVPAENVRVAEYLNYYEQRFPEPTDQPLGLDVRLGNTHVPPSGGDVWVQVGLQAQRSDSARHTPLNLALVLDKSGSMGDTGKMNYLKQSLDIFLHSLQPDDIVSIVAYSDDAVVLRSAEAVGDGQWISETIHRLEPEGWTNLHAGLMLGFEEVEKHFDIRRNNRVLLLTDGRANRGETNPGQIASDALAFNDQGIYLSTIGMGVDLDDHLLNTLANQGHGAYHYIDSYEEMDKVFREEAEGLVEKIAKDITITLEPVGSELVSITGFEGRPPAGGAQVKLFDMGAGDSQVLLAKFHVPASVTSRPLAAVRLTYTDVFGQRVQQITAHPRIYPGDEFSHDNLQDIEVQRNVTVADSAETLREIDGLFERGYYDAAWRMARDMEMQLREVAALTGDEQMVQDADLFRRYQVTLAEAMGGEPEPTTYQTQPLTGSQPQRWGVDITPTLPEVEVK